MMIDWLLLHLLIFLSIHLPNGIFSSRDIGFHLWWVKVHELLLGFLRLLFVHSTQLHQLSFQPVLANNIDPKVNGNVQILWIGWSEAWLHLFSYSLFIWVSIAERSTWFRFLSSSSSVFFSWNGCQFKSTFYIYGPTCSWKAMSWSREASLASSSPPRILSRSKAFLIASSSDCKSEMSDL